MTEKRTVQDKYGFVVEVPVGPIEPQEESFSRGLSKMWNTVLKPNPSLWGELDRLPPDEVLKHRMLKSLLRECGVPEPLRKKFWPIISGANDLKNGSRVVYADIVSTLRQYKNESSDQIEKDLNRSFPGHPYFDSPQGMKALRNVLTAFSWLNPAIGYTQSMNFWAGLMLLFVNSEETVFWLVVTVVERILPQQYYDQSMLDIIVDNQVLFSLLEIYLPRVYQHVSLYTTDLSPILTQWFLCLYVNTLPTELTLRILDVFLHEGNKVLFRAALGIFKCYEPEILKTESFEDLFMLIAKPVKIQDTDGFMTLIFDRIWLRAFGREKISSLREAIKKATIKVEQEKETLRQQRRAAASIKAQDSATFAQTSTSPPKAPTSEFLAAAPTAISYQSSISLNGATSSTPSNGPDVKRRTIRASMLPEEIKTVIDRKSWRAYKRSNEWHMIEEYFSTLDSEGVPIVVSAPNSDQRVPFTVSEPDSVPKASKTRIYKASTIAGTSGNAIATSSFNSASSPPYGTVQTSDPQKSSGATEGSGFGAATGQPKRRSYAEVAKSATQESATSGGASPTPAWSKGVYVPQAEPEGARTTARPPSPKKTASTRSGFNTLGKTVSNFMSSLRSHSSTTQKGPPSNTNTTNTGSSTSTSAAPRKSIFNPYGSQTNAPASMYTYGSAAGQSTAKSTRSAQAKIPLPSGPSVPSTRPKLTHAASVSSTTTPVPKFTAAISQNPRLTLTDSSSS